MGSNARAPQFSNSWSFLYPSAASNMAPKIRKDDVKNAEGKPFESVLIVCPKCREVKEIVQAKRGKMTFVEYYCCPGKALEVHSVTIKPN